MSEREKQMYNALVSIANRDCSGLCGLLARKALEKMRISQADEMITKVEQVIETYDKVFGK